MKTNSNGRKITGSYRIVEGEERSKSNDWQTRPTVPGMRKVNTPPGPIVPQNINKDG